MIRMATRSYFSLTHSEVEMLVEALTSKVVALSNRYDEVAAQYGHDSGAALAIETRMMEFDFLIEHLTSQEADIPSFSSEEQAEMQVQWGVA